MSHVFQDLSNVQLFLLGMELLYFVCGVFCRYNIFINGIEFMLGLNQVSVF